jgi:hypothetical protein
MYRFSTLIALLLCCCALQVSAQQSKNNVAAIAFYNLENYFNPEDNPLTNDEDFTPEGSHRYTENVFNQKAQNMAKVLADLGKDFGADGADLIGVCEVEDDRALQVLLQQAAFKNNPYRFIRIDGPDKRGINVALLYHAKRFKLLHAQSLPVSLQYAGGGMTRDVLLVKGVFYADTVYVLVNHWPSRSGGESVSAPKRALAAAVNKDAVAQIIAEQKNAKIIIMGDLNDDPVSPSVLDVLGTTGIAQHAHNTLLYNPWLRLYQQGTGTLCHNDHWNLFDQIILSPAWLQSTNGGWQYYQAQVYNKDYLKTAFGKFRGYPYRSFNGTKWMNGYSDHFPVVIYLKRHATQTTIE